MTLFPVILALLWAYFSYLLLSLIRNYNAAKALGIPIIISPVDVFHPLWYLLGNLVKPLVFLFPYRLRRWTSLYGGSWPFTDKRRIHREVGDVFALVNAWNFTIILADPMGADAMLHRRKDFIKGDNYKLFCFFGNNVFTDNGEDWARQRKITGPCFNERVSNLVWNESIHQAQAVLKNWTSRADGVVGSMVDNTRTIALHVLSLVGFGIRQDFDHGMSDVKPGHTMAYQDALLRLLACIIYVMIFPAKILNLPIFPKAMRATGLAFKEVSLYMDEMLSDERQAVERGVAPTKPNLMNALIRCSVEERNAKDKLSNEEIKGNLFIFNVAGHDTTANTVAYATALLSLDQKCQEWLREELVQYIREGEPPKYEEVFPRLIRCQAIMWETLRLYGPLVSVPRQANGPQSLPISGGRTILVPAGTYIQLNKYGIHISPSVWSTKDVSALDFYPQRWIQTSETEPSKETLIHPKPGTFLAWSSGPRVCLGMKFSQVEFVAIMSTLLTRHVIEPAVPRQTIEEVLAESKIMPTLGIVRKGDVLLRLKGIGDSRKGKA